MLGAFLGSVTEASMNDEEAMVFEAERGRIEFRAKKLPMPMGNAVVVVFASKRNNISRT